MSANRRDMLAGMAALGTAAALPSMPALAGEDSPLAGTYSGTLHVGPNGLRLRLDIGTDLAAVLTSLDQGNARIPVQSVTVDGDSISILIPVIGAGYEARLTDAGGLDGEFTQNGRTFPLVMERSAAVAPPPAETTVEAMSAGELHALRMELGTPGMGAAWRRGGERPTILVDGLRSANASLPLRPGDSWHIGSNAKSMTALLAARAVEAGVIGWDSTISSVLGKALPDIHPDFAGASLLHLLSHRSGLPTGAGEDRLAEYSLLPGGDIHAERIRFANSVLSVAPATPLGATMAYANAGYVVIGLMLEVLLGKPWERLIRDYVFGPLNLETAGIGSPGHKGMIDQPVGHMIGADRLRVPHFADLPAVLGPAGLVHANLGDEIAYLSAHLDRPERILRKESWERLHTPPFGGNYACGWVVLPGGQLMHTGSNRWWYAIALVAPNSEFVAAFAANDMAPAGSISRILRSLGAAATPGTVPKAGSPETS